MILNIFNQSRNILEKKNAEVCGKKKSEEGTSLQQRFSDVNQKYLTF